MVPGPVWTRYLEKVKSIDEVLSSIWTRVDPEGQPEPSSDTPTTFTYGGPALALIGDAASAATSPMARARDNRVRCMVVMM